MFPSGFFPKEGPLAVYALARETIDGQVRYVATLPDQPTHRFVAPTAVGAVEALVRHLREEGRC